MLRETPQGFGASFDVASREACLFHSLQVAAAQMVFRRARGQARSHGVHNPLLVATAKALACFLGPTSSKKNQVWVVSIHLDGQVASSVASRKSQLVVSTLSSNHSNHRNAMMTTHSPFAPRRAVATSSSACPVGHSTPMGSHLPSVVRSVTAVPVQDPFAVHQPFEGVDPPT